MTTQLFGTDVFMRHTNTDGDSYVMMHRVWDKETFIARQKDAAVKLNAEALAAKPEPKPAKAKSEQITEEQYQKERKK